MTQIQNAQPPAPQKGLRARLGKYRNNVKASTARLRESIPTEGPLAVAWEAALQLFRFLFNLLEVFFLAPLYGVYKVISRIPFVRAMGRCNYGISLKSHMGTKWNQSAVCPLCSCWRNDRCDGWSIW